MKKSTKPEAFLGKPEYPGGIKAMRKFLAEQKKYPPEALRERVEGTVHIRYTINHQGKVVKTQVISGIGHGCDQEAVRIVKLLKFKVGKVRKVKAQFHKTVRIHFRLPPKQEMKVSYTVTKSATKARKKPSISYQITLPGRPTQ